MMHCTNNCIMYKYLCINISSQDKDTNDTNVTTSAHIFRVSLLAKTAY